MHSQTLHVSGTLHEADIVALATFLVEIGCKGQWNPRLEQHKIKMEAVRGEDLLYEQESDSVKICCVLMARPDGFLQLHASSFILIVTALLE